MTIWRNIGNRWRTEPLAAALVITRAGEPPVSLVRFVDNGRQRAALVASPGARVTINGYAPLGVAVLAHRDEIIVGGELLAFSAYTAAEPTTFPADAPETSCARCKSRLTAGAIAVRCAACGAYHHEDNDRPCWTHDERCGGCARRRADLAWTPGDDDDDRGGYAPA